MQLAACWNPAGVGQYPPFTDENFLTWGMKRSRVLRVRFGYQSGDFDLDRPLWPCPLSARQVVALAYKYRLRLIVCADPSRGESLHSYHRAPHMLDVDELERYFGQVFSWLAAQPHEPLYGVQFGNELGYCGWLPRPYAWFDHEPVWQAVLDAVNPMRQLAERHFPGTWFILGGWGAMSHPAGFPSLNRWVGQRCPGIFLDWHPHEDDTPSSIEQQTRALKLATGLRVAICEDVYNDGPDLLARALAARAGGACLWTGWFAWPRLIAEWGSGIGTAPDTFDQPWDKSRADELHAVSVAFNRYRPDLQPRGEVAPPPPPPPDDESEKARLRQVIHKARRDLVGVGDAIDDLGVENLISGPGSVRYLLAEQMGLLR